MVQVISTLGPSDSAFDAATIVRPIPVSVAFAIAVLITSRYVAPPLRSWLELKRLQDHHGPLVRVLAHVHTALLVHAGILLALIVAASYAGTSNLFAAYFVGTAISWWDESRKTSHIDKVTSDGQESKGNQATVTAEKKSEAATTANTSSNLTEQSCGRLTLTTGIARGEIIFQKFYSQPLRRILKPLLFYFLLRSDSQYPSPECTRAPMHHLLARCYLHSSAVHRQASVWSLAFTDHGYFSRTPIHPQKSFENCSQTTSSAWSDKKGPSWDL